MEDTVQHLVDNFINGNLEYVQLELAELGMQEPFNLAVITLAIYQSLCEYGNGEENRFARLLKAWSDNEN